VPLHHFEMAAAMWTTEISYLFFLQRVDPWLAGLFELACLEEVVELFAQVGLVGLAGRVGEVDLMVLERSYCLWFLDQLERPRDRFSRLAQLCSAQPSLCHLPSEDLLVASVPSPTSALAQLERLQQLGLAVWSWVSVEKGVELLALPLGFLVQIRVGRLNCCLASQKVKS